MSQIRFIHAADIHLGSYLSVAGNPIPEFLERHIRSATQEAFRRVCEAVLREDADFLILAGDLYDREAGSIRAREYFVEQAKILEEAGKDIYVIAGNHDPLREVPNLFSLPANVKTFPGEKPSLYEIKDKLGRPLARLLGQSYCFKSETKKIHQQYDELADDLWNIALLHTQLTGGLSNYVPCTLGELKGRTDIHYWALGHIHQPAILNGEYPFIVYPGIPQGRHFGEQGRGGCYLVDLSRSRGSQVSFLPVAPIIYKRLEVVLDQEETKELTDLEDLANEIMGAGERLLDEVRNDGEEYPAEGYIVEWSVTGRTSIAGALAEDGEEALAILLEILRDRGRQTRPFIWTNALSVSLAKPLDYDRLLKASRVRDELLCLGTAYAKEPNKIQANLRKELGEIWRGSEPTEEYIAREDLRFHLDEETFLDILKSAQERILEKLAEEADGH